MRPPACFPCKRYAWFLRREDIRGGPPFFVACGKGQPVPSGPIPAHRRCGSGSPDTGKGRGDAEGALPDTVRPSLPGLCRDVFGSGTGRNPAWMAWLFSHFCCPDSAVAASSVLGRCPFVAFLFRPLRGMLPLSCIPRCAAGTCGRTPVNKKGHPHGAGGP